METESRPGRENEREREFPSPEFRCDSCGSFLVKSRAWMSMGFPYYLKPWGKVLRMCELIVPWLCPECGRVYHLLEKKDDVREEWKRLPDELKAEKILKPDMLDDDLVGHEMIKRIEDSFER